MKPARHGLVLAGAVAAAALGARYLLRPVRAQESPMIPTIAAAAVSRQDLFKELTLQAEFRPYEEVELHAKVSGYLQKINVDFGDQVKAGDLIATIEVPELQDEKAQAIATAQRAAADYAEAHLEDTRLAGVNQSQPNLISQQELDTSAVKERTAAAAAAAAKADADKYSTLVSYTRITAPFDGVVTARYVDPGALIQTGSSASGPLIRLSENQRLRLDFPISVTYAADVAVGDPVTILLEGTAQPLEGKITRFSHRIDMATRTMETEVVVPNPDLKLIPGMYATVVLHVQKRTGALTVPLEAISSTDHPTVYLLGPQNRIEERAVTLGVETPTQYEVRSGLAEGDVVLVGSRASVQPGEQVQPKIIPPASTP